MKLSFEQIHHCAVAVTDPERARSFYRDILGLREIPRPSTFDPGPRGVLWFVIGHQHIHLIPHSQADPPGPRHLALQVADANAAREQLRRRGLAIRETTPIPGADRFFINDPDGNQIELIEWREPYPLTGR